MTLITNCSQLLTLAGGPRRGSALGELEIIPDGAVFIRDGLIHEVGPSKILAGRYRGEDVFDAAGAVVMPGFVDPHTHLVWAGSRAKEFEMRLAGKTYMEILASGGGILSTVTATRQASFNDLADQTRKRALRMFQYGTTTAEVKTGYGLTTGSELAQMRVILELDQAGPLEMIPTFLGAHAVAPEFKDDPNGYTRLIVDEMLPAVRKWWQQHAPGRPLPFVDVFCERGAFDLDQSRAILVQAHEYGFPLKIHADEFENLGGASLAAALQATSADHLVKTSADDIRHLAAGSTVAVALPCTPFGLGEAQYTPARDILAADGLLAIATDCNPGTAWCESMQFAIALACRYMKLTPAQAIAAATINAAAAIGRQDRLGSIESGKQADLIVLDAQDYCQLGYQFGANLVTHIIKKGEIYSNPIWN